MTSKPVQRLDQVVSHLGGRRNQETPPPHFSRFRPQLPRDLPINFTPLNPLSFLLKAASIRPDHVAILHPARDLQFTYREWALRVKDLAYAFKARGLQRGDRVLTLLPNLPCHLDALQATAAAQMIVVPINTRLSPADVDYIVEDSGSKLLLVDYELRHLLPSNLQNRNVQAVLCRDTEDDDYEALLREGRSYDQKQGGKEWSGLEFVADENETFAISYTSGTTSRPKGVETSYRSTYLAAVANAHEARLSDESRFLWTLPMFHCCGWCFPYATTLAMSTSICLRSVDYTEIWTNINERGVTHYCAAPTVQLSILNHSLARPVSNPVRTVVAGAAPSATLIEGLEKLGVSVVHVWGMTELLGPMTRTYYVGDKTSNSNYYRDMARQGFSFLTADDIRVIRLPRDGQDLDPNGPVVEVEADGQEVGEIVCRGNITMKAYFGKPQETAKSIVGGYLRTGDLAVRYPDGTFNITDRSKDLIISGGENISSLGVENAISSHPHVNEVAVVAKKHEKWGERPHAFVVLKPHFVAEWADRLDQFEQDLKKFLRGKIPPFAIPDSFTHLSREAFDKTKTATGKVQKKELRDLINTEATKH